MKDKLVMKDRQFHLGVIQSIIQRMTTNSNSCKTWCITLVSAILVIAIDKNPSYIFIAIIPTIFLSFLDAYYLALERFFRQLYNNLIDKFYNETITIKDLNISLRTNHNLLRSWLDAFHSFSIYLFYGFLIIAILILFIVRYCL